MFTNRKCSSCRFTDGLIYTSNPPKIKCTLTGKFHTLNCKCDCDYLIAKMVLKKIKEVEG